MANGSRKSFGRGGQTVSAPRGTSLGSLRNLGRSGRVRRATREQVEDFRKKRANQVQSRSQPSRQQREQIEKAAKGARRPEIAKTAEVIQRPETVKRGKSGTLQRTTPDPEVQVEGRNVQSEARELLRGTPAIAGDLGTEILLSEARRRGLKGNRALASVNRAAKEAGLEGLKKKGTVLGRTLIPIGAKAVFAAVGGQALSSAFGAGTGATSSSGAGATPQAVKGGAPGFIGKAKGTAELAQVGAAPVTAGGSGFIGPGKSKVAVGQSAAGASSAFETAKTAFRGARLAQTVSSLLGGRGETTGSETQIEVPQLQQFPQLVFQAPQRRRTRQTLSTQTVAGAQPAGLRNLRDKFGGTSTASLFSRRQERFGARTRGSILGR